MQIKIMRGNKVESIKDSNNMTKRYTAENMVKKDSYPTIKVNMNKTKINDTSEKSKPTESKSAVDKNNEMKSHLYFIDDLAKKLGCDSKTILTAMAAGNIKATVKFTEDEYKSLVEIISYYKQEDIRLYTIDELCECFNWCIEDVFEAVTMSLGNDSLSCDVANVVLPFTKEDIDNVSNIINHMYSHKDNDDQPKSENDNGENFAGATPNLSLDTQSIIESITNNICDTK